MSMAAEATSTRPLILVVDDDPDIRLLTQMRLQSGFEIIEAASGTEALELAAIHSPDVILLDIMMPGMDGSDVIRALAREPATADIPVVFVSALAGLEDRVRGLESGAVDYIVKTADAAEFYARVTAAARRSRPRSIPSSHELQGLEARERFESRVREEVARSNRSLAPLSIMILDVDHMAEINDRLGSAGGDRVLSGIAESLRTTLRISDVLFRYGADEFAVILPDTEVPTAYLVAERCRDLIKEAFPDDLEAAVSIGVAELSPGRTPEELVAKVEIALFRAKESGGGCTWRADDPRRHGLNPISLSEELTEREWSVLGHLAHHRTEKDIARRLGIRPGTVRSHKARIRRKLHVAPNIRLGEFARTHFRDLIDRLGHAEGARA